MLNRNSFLCFELSQLKVKMKLMYLVLRCEIYMLCVLSESFSQPAEEKYLLFQNRWNLKISEINTAYVLKWKNLHI